MVAPLVIAALAASATSSIVGGYIEANKARDRSEFYAKLYREQAKTANFFLKRKVSKESGQLIANTAGRGIAISGTPAESILSSNFDAQLERVIQKQAYERQAVMQEVQGAGQASDAIGGGYGQAIDTLVGAALLGKGGKK